MTRVDIDAWVRAYAQAIDRGLVTDGLPCPRCGWADLKIAFGRFDGDRGVAWIWSPHCGLGARLSRVTIPGGAESFPLDAVPPEVLRQLDGIAWENDAG